MIPSSSRSSCSAAVATFGGFDIPAGFDSGARGAERRGPSRRTRIPTATSPASPSTSSTTRRRPGSEIFTEQGEQLPAREARPLPRGRRHRLRLGGARRSGRSTSPPNSLRLPRPLVLPRHGTPAAGERRLRMGVRDRARGRAPRAAACRARATRSTRSAAPEPRPRERRARSGSSCRPTATRASGRTRFSRRGALARRRHRGGDHRVRGRRRRPAPAANRPAGAAPLVHARLLGTAPCPGSSAATRVASRPTATRSRTRTSDPAHARGPLIRSTGMHSYAFFDTALGRCAITWGPRGIAAVELPGSDDRSTRAPHRASAARRGRSRPRRRRCSARSTRSSRCSTASRATSPTIALDMERRAGVRAPCLRDRPDRPAGRDDHVRRDRGPDRRARRRAGGRPGRSGATRSRSSCPCHRVLAADGSLRGFSAPGGIETKRRMLAIEGAGAPTLFA